MGRNWDNQNVGSIIVSLYHPPAGYASISFSRAIDLGFPLHIDLAALRDEATPVPGGLHQAPAPPMLGSAGARGISWERPSWGTDR